MVETGIRRPTLSSNVDRRPGRLPQKLVKNYGHDRTDQDEHRTPNADPVAATLALRAGAFHVGHSVKPPQFRGQSVTERPLYARVQLRERNDVPNMRTSHDSRDQYGRQQLLDLWRDESCGRSSLTGLLGRWFQSTEKSLALLSPY